eukprot:SAG22_NODE_78_length_22065_cov_7.473095_3_plen_127_part_00
MRWVPASQGGDILNIVYGCNHALYTPDMPIVTAASCTTNCIAPVIKVIKETVGIVHGSITTMHCVTNTQPLVDAFIGKKPTDLRRARSGPSVCPSVRPASLLPSHSGLRVRLRQSPSRSAPNFGTK